MKIHLFQELLTLNEEFGHVLHGLERPESISRTGKGSGFTIFAIV
jgi:hypothetical protein